MKIAVLYSFEVKGFVNHFFRFQGFLNENPGAECVWFEFSEMNRCSRYSWGKFDKCVVLGDKDKLSEKNLQQISKHKITFENVDLNYALKNKHHEFFQMEKRWVFCPSEQIEKNWTRAFWKKSHEFCPTLFLCQEQSILECGANPGTATFFAPVTPQLHLDAVANASCVISFSWEPCLVARSAGKVAIKLSEKTEHENSWGVVEVSVSGKTPEEVFEECRNLYQSQSRLVKSPVPKFSRSWKRREETVHVTSVSDFSYLPFYLGMVENILQKSETGVQLHLLALDELVRPFMEREYPDLVRVYELKDVWSPEELKVIEGRAMAFRAFSSKPKILQRVLRDYQSPTFHCDSDVYFFACPEKLSETFSTGHTVVFPHWNDAYPEGRNDGLYNAGMIGVRPGAEPFVKWWGEQCLANCSFDPEKGIVGDQAYLDFAPILFEGVTIYRKKDHNVARWNLKTLAVHFSSSRLGLEGEQGKAVQTFHAAFIDSFGFFEFKYCWDQLITFFSRFPVQSASPAYRKNVLVQQQKYWLSLSRGLKGRDWFYRYLPILGPQPEEKAPLFWIEGLGGHFLRKALKLRDILPFRPANQR